jgi:predicted Zn-dependent protease
MRRKVFFLCFLVIHFFGEARIGDPVNADSFFIENNPIQSIAAIIYREYLSSHKILTAAETPELETVNRISNRVITAVKNYYGEKKAAKELDGFRWEVSFIQEKKADAWCLPGGKIAVYSPLLPITQSDASLAIVIAHEIAHVMLKHGDIRMKQYLKEFLGQKNISSALSAKPVETKDFYRMAYGNGDYVGVIRGFSAENEREADYLGAIFSAMAGYKPAEAIVFLERMTGFRNTGRTPEFMLTHPIDEKRVPNLKEVVDEISRNYYKPISKN